MAGTQFFWHTRCPTKADYTWGVKKNVVRYVVGFLQSRGLVQATAESRKAGLIASQFAEVPVSGACLDVGFVVYSPSGKSGFLGVLPETIKTYGLTSEEVAREMAEGTLAQEPCKADVAVANTSLAGPPLIGDKIPAGTQCFAWSYRWRSQTYTFSETKINNGDRNTIRHAAALYALSRVAHYFDAAVAASARHTNPSNNAKAVMCRTT
jgi:nicotinamide-nucleotide amidase